MKYVKSIPRLFFMSSIMKSINFHSKKAQNSLKIKYHSTEAGEGIFFSTTYTDDKQRPYYVKIS